MPISLIRKSNKVFSEYELLKQKLHINDSLVLSYRLSLITKDSVISNMYQILNAKDKEIFYLKNINQLEKAKYNRTRTELKNTKIRKIVAVITAFTTGVLFTKALL